MLEVSFGDLEISLNVWCQTEMCQTQALRENSNLRTSKGVLAQLEPFRRFHTKVVCVCLFEDTPCLLQMLRILVFATFLPRTEATFATFVSRQYLSVSRVS